MKFYDFFILHYLRELSIAVAAHLCRFELDDEAGCRPRPRGCGRPCLEDGQGEVNRGAAGERIQRRFDLTKSAISIAISECT